MKKLLLLLSFMSSLSIQAYSCFTGGSAWIVDKAFYNPYMEKWVKTTGICMLSYDDYSDYPNLKGLTLYENDYILLETMGTKLGLIETIEDKVYFKKESDDSDWFLFYDFGLEPGDKTEIYSIYRTDEDGKPLSTTIECLEVIENDPDYNGLTTMRVQGEAVVSPDNETLAAESVNIEIWIKGFGSTCGVTQNYKSLGRKDVKESTLLEVWSYGNVIYKNENYNGIETVEPDTSKQSEDPSAPVYDLTGRMVGKQADLNTLPSGIYISNGKKVVK